jgi:outer membrane protein assembly factor BamB
VIVLFLAPAAAQRREPPPTLFFPLGIDWSVSLAGPPAAWPAFDEHQAYVPLRTGELVAVSLKDGAVAWTVALPTEVRPAAGGGLVMVAGEAAIHGLDATSGRVRWRTPVDGAFSAPLLWDEGWLIASFEGGRVAAFRGDNGAPLWVQILASEIRVPPSIAADRVYVPLADGRIVALDLRTGATAWERRLGGRPAEILALDDRLYAGSGDNFFYCLSVSSGRVQWRWRTGGDIIGAPVVDESRVYFTSLDHLLRALDRNNGAQRWRQPLPVRPLSGPLRLRDVVLVSGLGQQITGFSARTGRVVGRFVAPSEIVAPPHLVDAESPEERTAYILTGEGTLHALVLMVEPRLVPLGFVPGTPVLLIPPPPGPLDFIPGVPVPLAPAPGHEGTARTGQPRRR